MDILHENGLPYSTAQKLVLMEGDQKVNKNSLSLLGTPIYVGSIEDLSNKQEFWNTIVETVDITGIFRKNIKIIIKDGETDA